MDRLNELTHRVVAVLEDASGYDLVGESRDASFSELGFDSLLLTQVSTALTREFDVDVSFRSLMEDCSSIGSLVQYIEQLLPAAAAPVSAAPEAAAAPDAAASAQPAAPRPMSEDLVSRSQLQPDGIRALIDKQLAIMQLQLQALAGSQPASMSQEAVVSSRGEAAEQLAAAPAKETAPRESGSKRTPGTRIERSKTGKTLTQAQEAYVQKLVSDYTSATKSSKEFAQRHRKHMADPRTASGFHPLWKEMVYPIVTNRSRGSNLWDLDGREYIDLTNGFGPIFFGHSPEFITEAVLKQINEGIEIGPQSPLAGEVAELFCAITGNERVAFANTGSEAVLAALRLARTVTRRDTVVIFEGAYHGIFDEVVVRPGKEGKGLPAAPGIPRAMTSNVVVLPYGAEESLERIRAMAPEIAAVMVEPVQSRKPGVQPVEFLREIRRITEESGSAFIFDEVVTGFRVHPGGAQALFDIRADLAVYGKVAAGGYPIGLLGGKAKFMDALDGGYWQFGDDSVPEVGVTFFAGTFVRHPVALAATKAVMQKLLDEGPALQQGLADRTATLAQDIKSYLSKIQAAVSLEEFSSFFYVSAAGDEPYGSLLFYLLRLHGIHIWEFRPCFLTASHSDEDIAKFKSAFIRAVSELVRHGLISGDAVAVERHEKGGAKEPPVAGAKLGKDKDGMPAWFVPDPERPGKYKQVV